MNVATKLTPAEVATLERWIATGANTARPEPENISGADAFTEEERSFWDGSMSPIGVIMTAMVACGIGYLAFKLFN